MAPRIPLAPPQSNGKEAVGPASVRGREIGRTGLRIWSGRIDEEFLRQLQGTKGWEVYREMATNDAVVGAVLTAIELMMRQVVWRVEAGTSERSNQEIADFVDSCRQDMDHTWEDLLSEILSMLVYGYSIHEEVYKQRTPDNSRFPDGKIGWAKLPIRSQDTLFKWDSNDETGEVRGFIQTPPPDYKQRNIPFTKALHFRPWGHKNNPEGASILRRAYEVWYYKKSLMRIEAIGIERDLAGYPVLYGPKGENGAVDTAAENIIQNIRRDEQEGAYLPSARDEKGNRVWELLLLSTGGQRQYDTNAILQRYDTRIAQTMLADFILIGHEKVGSFALSSDKTHLFSVALGAWLDAICAVFNRTAIPRLLALNGIPLEQAPKLMHGDVETVNLLEFGDFISQLAGAGMPLFPNFQLENKIHDLLDIGRMTKAEWDQREAQRKVQAAAQQQQQQNDQPPPKKEPVAQEGQ